MNSLSLSKISCSQQIVSSIYVICVFIAITLSGIHGVPVDFANGRHNPNDSPPNRPFPPNQFMHQHHSQPNRNFHYHPSPAGQGPVLDTEEYERSFPSHNQDNRNTRASPPEHFGRYAQGFESNMHHNHFEETHHAHQMPNQYRHQQPPRHEAPDSEQRRHERSQGDPRIRRQAQEKSFAFPPLPPPPQPYAKSFDEFHQRQRDNSIVDDESAHKKFINPQGFYYEDKTPFQIKRNNLEEKNRPPLPPPFPLKFAADTPSQGSGQLPKASTAQFRLSPTPPKIVAVLLQGPDGNSTLFIEYDVSDNAITYETTMEVDDAATEQH